MLFSHRDERFTHKDTPSTKPVAWQTGVDILCVPSTSPLPQPGSVLQKAALKGHAEPHLRPFNFWPGLANE